MNLIVSNLGYSKIEKVFELINNKTPFSIYKTHKNTSILIIKPFGDYDKVVLYRPKKDRLPYALVEGEKIISAERILKWAEGCILDTKLWNNNNQIITYEMYDIG